MSNKIRIEVHESMGQVLERIRKEVSESMKRTYNLDEITIYGTIASQIAAGRLNGQKEFDFKIRKIGLNKGVLELL
jgi:hypothetical protein